MVAPTDSKATAAKDAGKAAVDVSFEEDDVFEEFASQAVIEGVAPALEEALLWEVDWDDEDQRDDFLPRVKQELAAKSMTE